MTVQFNAVGFDPDFVDYRGGWDLQRRLHTDVSNAAAPSTVLLLEHSPTYTAGKRTEDHERPADGTDVIAVDRGGKLTWHGPGQLVAYPILKLADPHAVREYVRTLEDVLLAVLARNGIHGQRADGRAGIWIAADDTGPDRKIAAIGIRVHDGVTMHGVALNCNNSLAPYRQIIACGIADAGTTTMSVEAGRQITVADVVPQFVEEFAAHTERLVEPQPNGHSPALTKQTGTTRRDTATRQGAQV